MKFDGLTAIEMKATGVVLSPVLFSLFYKTNFQGISACVSSIWSKLVINIHLHGRTGIRSGVLIF